MIFFIDWAMENKQLTLPPKSINIGKFKMDFFVRLFCSCMNPCRTFALTQYPCQPIKNIVYLINFFKNMSKNTVVAAEAATNEN